MKIKEVILYAAAAVFMGLGLSYLWHETAPEVVEAAEKAKLRISEPAQENIGFDTFTLRLLQAAMETQPAGNVLVAPNSVAALLGRFRELGDGPARAALDALELPQDMVFTSAEVRELALLFPDKVVPLLPEHEISTDVIPVPYHQSVSDAFIAINKAVSYYSDNALSRTVGSENLTPEVNLMSLCGAVFQESWMESVSGDETQPGDFFNGNGGMPRVPMMRHRGSFRIARAENGEWEAVALFFRNVLPEGDTACMVAVLPKDSSARAFAKEKLTPGLLSEIRQALYKAEPEPGVIEMPRLIYPPVVQDMHSLFSQLGLGALFMEEAPLPGLTQATPFHLDCAFQQCLVELVENKEPQASPIARPGQAAADADSPVRLRFDHPFIWFIGNLTSPTAPYLMGVVEDL